MTPAPLHIAVLASGGGTNFQALLDHRSDTWRVALLVCNREAGAIDRARAAGVDWVIVPTKDRDTADVGREMLEVLERHAIDVLCLAGYLRLLPAEVVRRFSHRILNIHPALLPNFGGKGMYGARVHEAVVASGSAVTGATVHLVDEEYDRGVVIAQQRVPVHPGDSAEQVAARVLAVEHELYPRAVDHLCAAILAGRDVEPMTGADNEPQPETTEDDR